MKVYAVSEKEYADYTYYVKARNTHQVQRWIINHLDISLEYNIEEIDLITL